jgi:hypothetical protein
MRLIHYTEKEFELEPRVYDQAKLKWYAKPHGFWVSVEGEDDWKEWCEKENFRTEGLLVSYDVILKENAKILHLKTTYEIIEFTKIYNRSTRPCFDTYEINWVKLKDLYQGIIIAPYQWDCRLALETSWYYTWDCASGCIWDLDCIEEFKLRKMEYAK